jgi:hypothetical protein
MQTPYVKLPVQATTPTPFNPSIPILRQQLLNLGSALVRFLAPDDSIQVRKIQRHDQPLWLVYDRYTDRHLEFYSEREVGNWLGR